MDLSLLKVRHLRGFAALAEALDLRRAAARLHISPRRLSAQVDRLEALAGGRLCERAAARVRLTRAGEAFLPHVRKMLRQLEDIVDTAARLKDAATRSKTGGDTRR